MPKGIFLVSHELYNKATKLFYSKNKFEVLTLHRDFQYKDKAESSHNEVLRFLRVLPHRALQHVRSLALLFPFLSCRDFVPGGLSHFYWEATWSFIAEHLDMSRLTLTLEDISISGFDPASRLSAMEYDAEYRLRRDSAEFECYLRIINPLIQLKTKPKSLSVIYCKSAYFFVPSRERCIRPGALERMVMGYPDRNDEDRRSDEDSSSDMDEEVSDTESEKYVYRPDGLLIWPLVYQPGNSDFERIIY
ncbi:hypothetical protein MMC34_006386 [Xylographa carneopallida]|nr:hypothetical protein [Xylographa carneopallida]